MIIWNELLINWINEAITFHIHTFFMSLNYIWIIPISWLAYLFSFHYQTINEFVSFWNLMRFTFLLFLHLFIESAYFFILTSVSNLTVYLNYLKRWPNMMMTTTHQHLILTSFISIAVFIPFMILLYIFLVSRILTELII